MNKPNAAELEAALTAIGWRREGIWWVHPRRDRKFACPSAALLCEYRITLGRAIRAEAEANEKQTGASILFMLLAIAVAAASVLAVMLYG